MNSTLRMGWIVVTLCVIGGLVASDSKAEPLSYSLYAGYGKVMEDGAPSGSLAFRGNAFMMMDPVIGVGAEAGYAWLGSTTFAPPIGENKTTMYHVTANVRARGVTGGIRPYGIGGLGIYGLHGSNDTGSSTETKFGFNLGGGFQHRFPDSSTSLGIEARWHMVPNGAGLPGDESALDMLTVTAGVDFN